MLLCLLLVLSVVTAQAQIKIGGSVYGGGNEGDVGKSTSVTVRAGDLNKVYGGARMANVGGSAFVNIDGAGASSYILINQLYGGNDISGEIGKFNELPEELDKNLAEKEGVTTDWNAFVHISTKTDADGKAATDAQKIYIGQLFGGGNGDYDYSDSDFTGLQAPALGKTYLQLLGGSIVNAFGGGNKAKVTEDVVIHLDNPSEVVNHIMVDADGTLVDVETEGATDLLNEDRFRKMGFNYKFTYPNSGSFQIGNLFGGNNKVDMAIRPKWHLEGGLVRNIYSGGNEGRMTNPEGLLLEIDETSKIIVDNVYGGCRRADVRPLDESGNDVANGSIQLSDKDADGKSKYSFPAGFSARVLVRGGDVNNVYGGNDISGNVYGGNAVGVYTSIRGDVYGGGNGSYSYTDNEELKEDLIWKDFYYNPDDVLESAGQTKLPETNGLKSALALSIFRPNAEQISIRVVGTEDKPTLIGGSIFVGGNSATVKPQSVHQIADAKVHLKIGSYAIAENVFLGNNGEQMVDGSDEGVLARYAGKVYMSDGTTLKDFSTIDLTNEDVLAKYMEGCATYEIPSIVFDSKDNGDPANYVDDSSTFGSIFCGGNVGSMILDGKTTISFNHKINVFDKVVGGCNNANVPMKRAKVRTADGDAGLTEMQVCANYEGGFLTPGSNGPVVGESTAIADKLELNMIGLNISPKRWKNKDDKSQGLEWNTVDARTGQDVPPPDETASATIEEGDDAWYVRLKGGNVYGGCYNSGHIDGNVVINLAGTVIDRQNMFATLSAEYDKLYGHDSYTITKNNSGVVLDLQGMDALGMALNVFGGGYGEDSEIWGSTTINLTEGYTFQIFGGGEHGAVGRGTRNAAGKLEYNTYDPRFSTTINMHGSKGGYARNNTYDDVLAEAEFIYGGGFEGAIMGDTRVYLGNGRLFNSFAGSCNADILGHTETYVGLNSSGVSGFPWVRDHIYGGNDLGGEIKQQVDFSDRLSDYMKNQDIKAKIHDAVNSLKAAAYTEYRRGRVENIFGGCFGDYDYTDQTLYGDYTNEDGSDKEGFTKPRLVNAFVNFRPDVYSDNAVLRIFGAGQGHTRGIDVDKMQDRSYVLIDIQDNNGTEVTNFQQMEVFGSGSWCGLGMNAQVPSQTDKGAFDEAINEADQKYSAVIDLFRGDIGNVYGGSFNEGFTRRTVVNVPSVSTIKVNSLFGGAYGENKLYPCDVFESHVNYHSENATVAGNIYGGNNKARRTLYSQVNVTTTLWSDKSKGYTGTVFGAGYGVDTWAQYTEVNLEDGASVYEVYGGGDNGKVYNVESLKKWKEGEGELDIQLGGWPDTADSGLENYLVHQVAYVDDGGKYNTNVHIQRGATVGGYAYGGGLGDKDKAGTGDVYGTTYIDLLGGTVTKDLYAAGTSGAVKDDLMAGDFTASATAYIKGGTARNVYGGGWKGSVGKHDGLLGDSRENDVEGETHVIIGDRDGIDFYNGIPTVQRNAYGGGEGGAVFGTANITIRNGYIGYVFAGSRYEEKINDETWTDHVGENRLYDSGCVFGGGYIDNSSVDRSNVTMWCGHVRNSLFGGGEIAAVGRGETNEDRTLKAIYKAGTTYVKVYDGFIGRDVFGGGRGYNNLGEHGTLYSDGFVFGKTEVDIYGGEIGTADGVALGYGNVFGGGDIGFVYSAYEEEGTLGFGKKSGERYDDADEGYYYKSVNDEFQLDGTEKVMTEDCKVLIEPKCRLKVESGDQEDHFKDIDHLNQLGNKTDGGWDELDDKGIIIHNAVFAGGNTSTGSDDVFANTTTVFGNATASIHDIYHRDLITIGTGHTGGLYGDGNLTFVDGYRGLNITNYGTDYYSIKKEITFDEYEALPEREAAYYELRYKCIQECIDIEGTVYRPEREEENGRIVNASTITADELLTLFKDITVDGGTPMLNVDGTPNADYWVQNGVCSRYAGRIMNTIQRADFCGVFGSRMVMQGAPDRVPETVDYTNYTINRVREVSLNKENSVITTDAGTANAYHGNYFGIYNIVNFLGGLTSDVDFGSETEGDVRTSDNIDTAKYGPDTDGQTFYDWKEQHHNEQKRNNGNSYNQVALASGVYLELTTEKSTGTGLYEKDWGYITGVIELDLINVQTGVGGGFVYARNEHGVRSKTNKKHITLTLLNKGAVTREDYTYSTDDANKKEWQTSGNFVHSTQIIIDDCYNISGKYKTDYKQPDGVPAHYWFIKGQVYVYDQYVSAYTGAPNAYSETVNIPLTITAASHGTMKLLDVKSNLYAYYATNNGGSLQPLGDGKKLIINDVTYEKNSPISYWDWKMLTRSEQSLFVSDTYVVIADCSIGGTDYQAGDVLTSEAYKALATSGSGNNKPTVIQKKIVDGEEQDVNVDFDLVVRSSNNMSHDTGFILTYKVNNPPEWDQWYTPISGSYEGKIDRAAYDKLNVATQNTYEDGPTYRLTSVNGGVFGQRSYKVSSIIANSIYDTYQTIVNDATKRQALPAGQAKFEPAYIVTQEIESAIMKDGTTQRLYPGARLAKSDYTDEQWTAMSGSVEPAYLCTSTIQLTKTEHIYSGTVMSETEKSTYYSQYHSATATDEEKLIANDINELIVPAYYCTEDGLYGGNYYEPNKNYRGLEAWCSMSDVDRQNFKFNYDALDLLVDPTYGGMEGQKYQYDGYGSYNAANADKMIYSLERPVDYTATYNGNEDLDLVSAIDVRRNGTTVSSNKVQSGDEISRTDYEALPNEKRHYAPVAVTAAGDYYVVHTGFQHGETPYAVGQVIEESTYAALGSDQGYVTKLTFDDPGSEGATYYFCREEYTIDTNSTEIHSASGVSGAKQYDQSGTVDVGVVIDAATYNDLRNQQNDFTIHGIAPVETTTLFVSRNSDINDLSTEKIITVIYEYDYEESDELGLHITPISERHVVNIHVQFKSGVPSVEDISTPKIVLPGTSVSIRTPNVTPGAYEVTGGGWELFRKQSDAESHLNGTEYTPTRDPLYWYQNDYYLAYYALTYLGKTYSNHVKVSVANYHDLAEVMGDKSHHYYIDHEDVDREPKIYINNYKTDDPATSQNGLDLLRNLIDLTHVVNNDTETGQPKMISGGELDGHMPLDLTHTAGMDPKPMKGGEYLEFFLRSDQNHSGSAWTPIANKDGECFNGILHGDGFTISGLDNSLFNHLCGSVYNLGVTGSFSGAGVAETGDGYVENCWIKTTGTPAKADGNNHYYAVFGNPSRDLSESKLVQVVNCYYPESNKGYEQPTGDNLKRGMATQKPDQSFFNGEVAYDLNGFYLNKRYYDHQTVTGEKMADMKSFKANADGTLPDEPTVTNYPQTPDAKYGDLGYVEGRFRDGDFIYAGGSIPDGVNERLYVTDEASGYYPVWPDDYLFFGQMLTYGHVDNRPHQLLPSHVNKSGSRLATTATSINRVYRAPAYFQSKVMGVAHYNPYAIFAAQYADQSHTAYPSMTAIDFTGTNDGAYQLGTGSVGKTDAASTGFYPPLLDNDGLTFFRNVDLTKNLLAYVPSATDDAANKTNAAVMTALNEPDYVEANSTYRTVAAVDAGPVTGHPVVQTASGFTAPKNHFLVDKQDFNAPLAYSFASDKLMFYQRTPENFVDRTKGWEGISLPFSAELVTTQTKGEITHFYGGSTSSYNGTGTKLGHEYWLREFAGDGRTSTEDAKVYVANFNYPAAGSDGDKEYTNTFLWDYYYQFSQQRDANQDKYQTYYRSAHTHPDYGYSQAAQPYVIGFPGSTYYEFDLSGKFKALKTYEEIAVLPKQLVTFVSKPGISVGVSDDEIEFSKVNNTNDGYIFTPNYLAKDIDAGAYVLSADGGSYDVTEKATMSVPFRPYFTATDKGGTRAIEQIVFGQSDDTKFGVEEHGDPTQEELAGGLNIYAKKHKIVVESSLRYTTDVRIVTPAGITVAGFAVRAGETVEVRVDFSGMYIVQTEDRQFTKKLTVKR